MQASQSSASSASLPALIDQCIRRIDVVTDRDELEEHEGTKQLARHAAEIALDNWQRGRDLHRSPSDPPTGMPDSYIDRILRFIETEEPTIRALRDGDDESWAEVSELLEMRVFGYLLNLGLDPRDASDLAPDLAQSCAAILWERALDRYTYDTHFGAWVTRIADNVVSEWRHSAKEQRAMRALSLDEALDSKLQRALHELVADRTAHRFVDVVEARSILEEGLAQLPSDLQRETIVRSLMGQSDAEIARALKRTKQAIYSLRQRALRSLRESLNE